jgi:putative hydrolase of the HAD superfamily
MRWLMFDAVGTLIAPREPVAATYQRVGARHGSRLTIDEARERFHRAFRQSELLSFVAPGEPRDGLTTSEPAERDRWRWVVAQVFADLDGEALDAAFTELWIHYAAPDAWIALPDAEETLHELRGRGWKLGVASNFDRRLVTVLEGLRGLPPFDAVCISSLIGWRKPAPEFYRRVIEACGAPPSSICFVGDHIEHDFVGAKTAGMRALFIDPHAAQDDSERLRSIRELLRIGRPT